MDTFRKWLNKPKADDKSLLARFYHADRSLTAVASELDSFDGRAEPDRCSRLVTRLRQGQDKVLSITNMIMEELLGNERDARAFRAKFPEEVLQENLAGQLWFGAECLAAGSSIMDREQESKDMRPLAQAVTKTLGTVRSLLREHCLKNNVPNSKTLHLDVNDSTTEQLYESLKIFDRLFAEFELRYVSAMVQVKTKQEYEMQELICVLFSETLQRAIKIGLIQQDLVESFDPALMFSIPRLAIIAGLIVYPKGPLNMDMPADQLSEMFRPFRTILTKIRDLLRILTKDELYQLQKLLCTNEDINIKIPVGSSSIEAPVIVADQQSQIKPNNPQNDCENTGQRPNGSVRQMAELPASSQSSKSSGCRYAARSPSVGSSISADSSIQPSTPHSSRSSSSSRSHSNSIASSSAAVATDSFTSAVTDDNWSDDDDDDDDDDDHVGGDQEFSTCADVEDSDELSSVNVNDDDLDDDDDDDINEEIMNADCASGYLVPNTNFGNLLQPQEIPLAGNFVASDDEFLAQLHALGVNDSDVSTDNVQREQLEASQKLNRLRLSYSSEESDRQSTESTAKTPKMSQNVTNEVPPVTSSSSCASCSQVSKQRKDHQLHHHHHHHSRHHHRRHCYEHCHQNHHNHHHNQRTRNYHSKGKKRHHSLDESEVDTKDVTAEKSMNNSPTQSTKSSSSADGSTSCSLSESESAETSRVLRTHGRMKFKSTENLLHRLFVCTAGVADQLQTNFASDLRQILRSVFLMNMSVTQDDMDDIPDKPRKSELFEFRASENDVIQQRSSGGSNQSIYSAEEANADADNVFNNNQNNSNNSSRSNSSSESSTSSYNSNRHSAGSTLQRANTIDGNNNASPPTLNQVGRSRSVGDQANLEQATSSRHLSSRPCRLNISPTQQHQQQHRKSSISSNSPTSFSSANSSPLGSENNSPLSERSTASAATAAVVRNHNNNRNSINVSSTRHLSPPAWIPDDKAPRCMSCRTPFTAFRRRHHCRNCGGVFCGVCSNASTPLPKYGLTKAVRVCSDCYMREILSAASANANQYACSSARPMHASNSGTTTTAGGS